MRRKLSEVLLGAVACGTLLFGGAAPAMAETGCEGTGSSGSSTGRVEDNRVEITVNAEFHSCGNNVTIIGWGNGTSDNSCTCGS